MDSKTVLNRRTAIGAALVAASPLLFPGRVRAQGKAAPADTFVILLKGLYQPVVDGPNLGLSTVDLSDGSYSTTKIYPVSGTPGNTNPDKSIGNFYVQFVGELCAYHIPGGSFSMRFVGSDADLIPDGVGGTICAEPSSSQSWRRPGSTGPSSAATITWWTTCTFSPQVTPMSTASATSAVRKPQSRRTNGKARSAGPSAHVTFPNTGAREVAVVRRGPCEGAAAGLEAVFQPSSSGMTSGSECTRPVRPPRSQARP